MKPWAREAFLTSARREPSRSEPTQSGEHHEYDRGYGRPFEKSDDLAQDPRDCTHDFHG